MRRGRDNTGRCRALYLDGADGTCDLLIGWIDHLQSSAAPPFPSITLHTQHSTSTALARAAWMLIDVRFIAWLENREEPDGE
ncbi:hypothetical protein Y032_0050g2001 [Ancylostoma ceylanicum]|uniref:Uncharacterized protein n=1 Tax=Ancylostoma ceylanicum TaxID=53326 RepID=A0A016U9L5_9BILA|nr:hypothetical protein Y032_0050g2001 [Ancylostoma ceylanicum]